jgi:hypothetical protein
MLRLRVVCHGLSVKWIEAFDGLSLLLIGPGMVGLASLAPGRCRIVFATKVLSRRQGVHGSNF